MQKTAEPGALPAYLRIAEHLTIEIGTGRLSPGTGCRPNATSPRATACR
jgi:hypothetical protein